MAVYIISFLCAGIIIWASGYLYARKKYENPVKVYSFPVPYSDKVTEFATIQLPIPNGYLLPEPNKPEIKYDLEHQEIYLRIKKL